MKNGNPIKGILILIVCVTTLSAKASPENFLVFGGSKLYLMVLNNDFYQAQDSQFLVDGPFAHNVGSGQWLIDYKGNNAYGYFEPDETFVVETPGYFRTVGTPEPSFVLLGLLLLLGRRK
jgi:hypothetical protein